LAGCAFSRLEIQTKPYTSKGESKTKRVERVVFEELGKERKGEEERFTKTHCSDAARGPHEEKTGARKR